jgi:hypothetical protein
MASTTGLKPRRSPGHERSRDTVEAIPEAAAQVFERHGYAAGTTNRVAERAGGDLPLLFRAARWPPVRTFEEVPLLVSWLIPQWPEAGTHLL